MSLRVFVIVLGVSMGLATAAAILRSPRPASAQPPEQRIGFGAQFEGGIKLAKDEYQPVLKDAYQELRQRYDAYNGMRWWARVAGYCGLVLTSVLTVVAGFYGANPLKEPDDVKRLLKDQQLSRGLTRLVGVLVAASTLPGAIAQRLETDAATYATSGRELWQVIAAAEEKLVDPRATVPEATALVLRVKEATLRSW